MTLEYIPSSKTKANFEEINELLQGATFRCVDEDLDILLDTPDGRTIVISTYFECLAVHSAGKSINITPNNFIAVNVWELGLYNDQH